MTHIYGYDCPTCQLARYSGSRYCMRDDCPKRPVAVHRYGQRPGLRIEPQVPVGAEERIDVGNPEDNPC